MLSPSVNDTYIFKKWNLQFASASVVLLCRHPSSLSGMQQVPLYFCDLIDWVGIFQLVAIFWQNIISPIDFVQLKLHIGHSPTNKARSRKYANSACIPINKFNRMINELTLIGHFD